MTWEEEQELHGKKIVELLDEISVSKHYLIEINNFKVANMLGRCYEMIKTLHITNTEAIRENQSMSDHHRTHFAGLAMQALLTISREESSVNTVRKAFKLADAMGDYVKQESKCFTRRDR